MATDASEHAKVRARQRFGVKLTAKEIARITRTIEKGATENVTPTDAEGRSIWIVDMPHDPRAPFSRRAVVVYSEIDRIIVTIMRADQFSTRRRDMRSIAQDYRRERLRGQ